jgi:hypothetical protein
MTPIRSGARRSTSSEHALGQSCGQADLTNVLALILALGRLFAGTGRIMTGYGNGGNLAIGRGPEKDRRTGRLAWSSPPPYGSGRPFR